MNARDPIQPIPSSISRIELNAINTHILTLTLSRTDNTNINQFVIKFDIHGFIQVQFEAFQVGLLSESALPIMGGCVYFNSSRTAQQRAFAEYMPITIS